MKTWHTTFLAAAWTLSAGDFLRGDQPAKVTEAVNVVEHGSRQAITTPAPVGTAVHDGEYLKTGSESRAEMLLPSTTITRLGPNTIFDYSAGSNTLDLQAGTVLFCKPKNAQQLNIKTAAVSAGIEGTTGFIAVESDSKGHKAYRLGIIEGHANAQAGGRTISLSSGDVLEIRPPSSPVVFAYDVPRFVKSSPLLRKFHSTLPNQKYIDAAIDNYQDEVSRGFITPPTHTIDYTGQIPVLADPQYGSVRSSTGGNNGNSSSSSFK